VFVPQALLIHGVYLLNFRAQTVPGNAKEFSAHIRVEVDTQAPGGGALPYQKFNQPVEASLTVGDDDIVDGKLPAFIAHYDDIKPGDLIVPLVGGNPLPGDAVEIPNPVPGDEFIAFGYSRAALEAVNGAIHNLGYTVTDKAGNPAQSRGVLLTIDLNSTPENLLAPLVPLHDDGLISDADARAPVQVHVPKFDKAHEKDSIVIRWGNQSADPVELTAADLIEDPFIAVQLPYALVRAALGSAEVGSVAVSYDVRRNGNLVASSPALNPVNVDLSLVGGPDPDPDPVHGNLLAAKIISASGQENDIPADDFDQNATAVIPWLAKDGTEPLQVGDQVVFTWGDQTSTLVPRTVTQTDVDDQIDLRLTVPSTTIGAQGSGLIPVFYTVTRGPNTSLAPSTPVTVANKGELPGGGTLVAPSFPVVNEFDAIGPNEIMSGSNGLYNPVRVDLTAINIAAGDKVELFFVGYDQLNGGNLVPDAEYNPQPPYTLLQTDMTRTWYEFEVPAKHHYAVCSRGGVEAHVIITNTKGATTSAKKRVFCDVKEPSWENCNNKP
jgi:hypothetical protein